ncbi:glycosyltransferase [Mycolicibacterium sp. P9-22]|uniref:glycosyltransferase n=1 Tax=Mycolicibacterium sp. P9-22 TaxID=2024613 RepID=UPI0011EC0C17|nr:glycosyltransferase [Mycolicibacterium sp. P9-22]KAA0118503.1 glycosyltransferase [Mycolicibacterium sp. P9-22]
MKVCFFVANLGDGGAQRQCVALLNLLQHNQNLDLHLMLLGPGEHEKDLDTSRLTIHRTTVRDFASPAALIFSIGTLRRIRPDLLISWLHPADIWSYVATRVVHGIPWVITERGSSYPDQLVYNVRLRFGRWGATTIIANSEPGRQLWSSLSPSAPIVVIPNMLLGGALPTDRATAPARSQECLYVGRLEPQKNVDGMAAAFAHFAAARPEAKLTVVGKGALAEQMRRIAEEAGVNGQMDLVGFRTDVPQLMSRARVLLSFSRNEGMPNVLMEAVVAGLPAVVSDIPEHHALLGDNYPFYVALDSAPEDAARVIDRAWCADDSALSQIYGHARQVLASSKPEQVASAYTDTFSEIVAHRRPGGRGSRWLLRGIRGKRRR